MQSEEYESEVKCCCCFKMRIAIFMMAVVYVLQVAMNSQSAYNSYLVEAPAIIIDVIIALIAAYVSTVLLVAGCRDTFNNRQRVTSAIMFSLIYNTLFCVT